MAQNVPVRALLENAMDEDPQFMQSLPARDRLYAEYLLIDVRDRRSWTRMARRVLQYEAGVDRRVAENRRAAGKAPEFPPGDKNAWKRTGGIQKKIKTYQ